MVADENDYYYMVYWPGQSTVACEKHARKLKALASAMGFSVDAEVLIGTETPVCQNCLNESKKEL